MKLFAHTHNRTKTIIITHIMRFYLSLLAMRTVTKRFPEITLCRSSLRKKLRKIVKLVIITL